VLEFKLPLNSIVKSSIEESFNGFGNTRVSPLKFEELLFDPPKTTTSFNIAALFHRIESGFENVIE
jgi:hypothetical protein